MRAAPTFGPVSSWFSCYTLSLFSLSLLQPAVGLLSSSSEGVQGNLKGGRGGSQTHQPRCDSASWGSLYSPSGSLNLWVSISCVPASVNLFVSSFSRMSRSSVLVFSLRFHLELSSRSTALHKYFPRCWLNRLINWPDGGRQCVHHCGWDSDTSVIFNGSLTFCTHVHGSHRKNLMLLNPWSFPLHHHEVYILNVLMKCLKTAGFSAGDVVQISMVPRGWTLKLKCSDPWTFTLMQLAVALWMAVEGQCVHYFKIKISMLYSMDHFDILYTCSWFPEEESDSVEALIFPSHHHEDTFLCLLSKCLKTARWIFLRCGTDIHGAQRMNPQTQVQRSLNFYSWFSEEESDSVEHLTFLLRPPSGWIL